MKVTIRPLGNERYRTRIGFAWSKFEARKLDLLLEARLGWTSITPVQLRVETCLYSFGESVSVMLKSSDWYFDRKLKSRIGYATHLTLESKDSLQYIGSRSMHQGIVLYFQVEDPKSITPVPADLIE